MFRLGTFGVATLSLMALVVSTASAGIEGTVRYSGVVPRSSVEDNDGRRWPLLHVDPDSSGLQYAVVYLEPEATTQKVSAPNPRPLASAVVDQLDFVFEPRVLAVRSGQDVGFTNNDAQNHNVHALAQERSNQFNISTGPGLEYMRQFVPEPKGAPIVLTCDIHAWMRGWVYVFDHPYFAVTDAQGRFQIDAPEGKYRLVVVQPDGRLMHEQRVRVTSDSAIELDILFTEADLGESAP